MLLSNGRIFSFGTVMDASERVDNGWGSSVFDL